MAVSKIPTLTDAAFWSQRTDLEGVDYHLEFKWNQRADAWYLSLYDVDGNPLVLSLKLVSNRPLLLRHHATPGVPAGELWMYDPTGAFSVAGYDELGTEVELLYIDAEDLGR